MFNQGYQKFMVNTFLDAQCFLVQALTEYRKLSSSWYFNIFWI